MASLDDVGDSTPFSGKSYRSIKKLEDAADTTHGLPIALAPKVPMTSVTLEPPPTPSGRQSVTIAVSAIPVFPKIG
jgi:hypothetical protein